MHCIYCISQVLCLNLSGYEDATTLTFITYQQTATHALLIDDVIKWDAKS